MSDAEVTGADIAAGVGPVDEGPVDEGPVDEGPVDEGPGGNGHVDERVNDASRFGAAVSDADARRVAEAVLMVATDPVPVEALASAAGCPVEVMAAACETLCSEYEHDQRGFVLSQVAGGWRLQSHPDMAGCVERFVLDGQSARLSAAALETLAIVAYKQPISRAQIAAIRGVGVDGVVRTLEQRGYIAEIARDSGPGQAALFGTTSLFLEKLGLSSLSALPPVASFVPDAGVVEQLEHGLRPVAPKVGGTAASGDAPDDNGGPAAPVSGETPSGTDTRGTSGGAGGTADPESVMGSTSGIVSTGGSGSAEGLVPPVSPQ